MPDYSLLALLSYIIVIAAIISIVRYFSVLTIFRPFIYYTWLASLSEILSTILSYTSRNTAVNNNIYVLLESLLLLWQFYNWRGIQRSYWYYITIGTFFMAVWVSDNIILHSLLTINSTFRVVYSFIIVLLGIDGINQVFMYEKGKVLKNTKFLICAGCLLFYSYKAIFEVFFFYILK